MGTEKSRFKWLLKSELPTAILRPEADSHVSGSFFQSILPGTHK
jgi:hypothetical protein